MSFEKHTNNQSFRMSYKDMSKAVYRYTTARDEQRAALEELRRIAIEECGFDQAMVLKSAPQDLVDGYIKGYLAAMAQHGV